MTIYIGNLSYEVSQNDLKQVFEEHGSVKSVVIPIDRETSKARGFAFVEMQEGTHEDAAITALDGAEWMGRSLRVSKARPKESTNTRGGGPRDRGRF